MTSLADRIGGVPLELPLKGPGRAVGRRSVQTATHAAPKRKRAKGSPISRSMDILRERGYLPDIVERRLTRTLTKDCWGIADIIAIKDGEVLAVQTTSSSNMAARVTKITESPHLEAVRRAGIRIVVHGWRRSQRKATKGQWMLRELEL